MKGAPPHPDRRKGEPPRPQNTEFDTKVYVFDMRLLGDVVIIGCVHDPKVRRRKRSLSTSCWWAALVPGSNSSRWTIRCACSTSNDRLGVDGHHAVGRGSTKRSRRIDWNCHLGARASSSWRSNCRLEHLPDGTADQRRVLGSNRSDRCMARHSPPNCWMARFLARVSVAVGCNSNWSRSRHRNRCSPNWRNFAVTKICSRNLTYTDARSRNFSTVAGPIPDTRVRSSTEVNGPFAARSRTI